MSLRYIESLYFMHYPFYLLYDMHVFILLQCNHVSINSSSLVHGANEIDYILFITIPNKSQITLNPHPDEVDDIKWVTQSQLLDMFNDKKLLFSPWFRIIAQRWMIGSNNTKNQVDSERIGGDDGGEEGWWDDLDRTMSTTDFCDYDTIHRFDPPDEHMGGAGNASSLFRRRYVEG